MVIEVNEEYFPKYMEQLGYVKVTHCRNCKYWWGSATAKDDETHICGILVDGNFDDTHTEANYYCASGEPKCASE